MNHHFVSCQIRTRIWKSTSRRFRAESNCRLHVIPILHPRSGLGVIVNAALFIVCFRHRIGTELVRDPGCGSEG